MGCLERQAHPRLQRVLHSFLTAWVVGFLGWGCATTGSGVEHVVKPGENLYRISQYYGVGVATIRRENRIRDVRKLTAGTRLWIPGARKKPPAGPVPGTSARPAGSKQPSKSDANRARREWNLAFQWPVKGYLSSRYGQRRGRPHEGIDIAAKSGTPIHAAESGRVIHSGFGLGAYGRVVIVKHVGDYSTVYAHNRKNYVRKGDFVEKGQKIAELGATGNATGPHLHFEIRHRNSAADPLSYLP
ncbi:LysM peptidoglycan-binding domain-containing M23 family metallopeptidase [Myxococcota bacterium]|nr:LysM peptidoglycan-binding domain-containing M23 family metallopeptidase [Myxococcota bacterium]